MAVNFVDLEVLPSAIPVTPVLVAPIVASPPSPPVVVAPASPSVVVASARPTAALDHSPSYWVRRRREQELIARALLGETSD